MTQVKILIADDHDELERIINDFLRQRTCVNPPRFLQIATDGEANYALLVAWEE